MFLRPRKGHRQIDLHRICRHRTSTCLCRFSYSPSTHLRRHSPQQHTASPHLQQHYQQIHPHKTDSASSLSTPTCHDPVSLPVSTNQHTESPPDYVQFPCHAGDHPSTLLHMCNHRDELIYLFPLFFPSANCLRKIIPRGILFCLCHELCHLSSNLNTPQNHTISACPDPLSNLPSSPRKNSSQFRFPLKPLPSPLRFLEPPRPISTNTSTLHTFAKFSWFLRNKNVEAKGAAEYCQPPSNQATKVCYFMFGGISGTCFPFMLLLEYYQYTDNQYLTSIFTSSVLSPSKCNIHHFIFYISISLENRKRKYMDRLLEQKRKGEQIFRTKINQFISKSPYAKKEQQFSPAVLQELLQMPFFESAFNNGRINIEKLCEKVTAGEEKYCPKELMRVLGGRREMKVGELQQLLRAYQLHEFNLEEQIQNLLFQNNQLSSKKLDSLMTELGMPPLNPKDKEILTECLDYDRDGIVDHQDIECLLQICAARDEVRGTHLRQ